MDSEEMDIDGMESRDPDSDDMKSDGMGSEGMDSGSELSDSMSDISYELGYSDRPKSSAMMEDPADTDSDGSEPAGSVHTSDDSLDWSDHEEPEPLPSAIENFTNGARLVSLTKAEFLEQHRSPLNGAGFANVLVGAAIFHPSTPDIRLLLLNRRADKLDFPNLWEIPGGKVDERMMSPRLLELDVEEYVEENISEALRRHVHEKSNLVMQVTDGMMEPMFFDTWEEVWEGNKQGFTKMPAVQLNFRFRTNIYNFWKFKVDEEEHPEWKWATREEAMACDMTSDMRRLVVDSFDWKEVRSRVPQRWNGDEKQYEKDVVEGYARKEERMREEGRMGKEVPMGKGSEEAAEL